MSIDQSASVKRSEGLHEREKRLVRLAVIVCIAAALLCALLAWFAYQRSRDSILQLVAESNRGVLRGLVSHLSNETAGSTEPVDPDFAWAVLRNHWDEVGPSLRGTNLCVIGPDGRIIACTSHGTQTHAFAGDWMLNSIDGNGDNRLRDLSRQSLERVGMLIDGDGRRFIAAYATSEVGDLLVGVHVESSLLTETLLAAAIPWWGALTLVALVLLPIGILTLHWMHRRVRSELGEKSAALAESEALFRQITESSHAGMWRMNREGYTLFANRRMCEMLEVHSPEELTRRNYREFFSPEMLEKIHREMAKRRHGIASTYEVEMIGARGTKRTIMISGAPLRGPTGVDDTLVATVVETTSLRRAEAALNESAERLQMAIAVAEIAIFEWDAIANATRWVGDEVRLFGLPANEVAGVPENCLARIHPDDRTRVTRRWERSLESSEPYFDEYRVLTGDHETHWVSVEGRLILDDAGRPRRMLGTARDITDVKRQQAELIDARHLLEQTFSSLRDAVLVVDRHDMQVYSCNDAVATVLGFAVDSLVGRSFATLYPDHEVWSMRRRELDVALSETGQYVRDDLIRRADGTTFSCELTITLLESAFEDESYMVVVMRDITARREAERAMRESEQRYRQVFEHSPDGIVIHRDSRVLFVNQAIVRLVGAHDKDELIGRRIEEFIPADMVDAQRERAPRAMAGETLPVLDGILKRPDGTSLHFEAVASPTFFEGAVAVQTVVRNITERRRAERALRESEARLRVTVDQLPAILWTTDHELQYTSSVGRGLERLGLQPNQVVGQEVAELFGDPSESAALQMSEMHRRALEGESVSYEASWGGRGYECHLEPMRDAGGTITGVIGLAMDVTERIEAQRALRENETRLRILVDQLPAILWTIDGDYRYTSSVGQGLRMVGLQPNQLVGRTIQQHLSAFSAEERDVAIDAHRRALEGEAGAYEATRYGHWFEAHVEPLHNPNGEIIGAIGLAVDVTERKRAERRQRLMMDELDHRVKNTLASIVSIAEQTLNVSSSLDEFRGSFLGRVVAMARTHEALASGKWEGVDLRGVVERIIRPYTHDDASRVTIDGPAVRLPASAALPITLTLHELATNAAKYGALANDTGCVVIRWSQPDEREPANEVVRIEWKETGGAAVSPPKQKGMGSQLIEGLIEYELRGSVRMFFDPSGFRCEIEVPLGSEESSLNGSDDSGSGIGRASNGASIRP